MGEDKTLGEGELLERSSPSPKPPPPQELSEKGILIVLGMLVFLPFILFASIELRDWTTMFAPTHKKSLKVFWVMGVWGKRGFFSKKPLFPHDLQSTITPDTLLRAVPTW